MPPGRTHRRNVDADRRSALALVDRPGPNLAMSRGACALRRAQVDGVSPGHVGRLEALHSITPLMELRRPLSAATVRRMVPLLVGRAHEVGVLTGAVDELRAGRGGFIHIAGEAGIGKTRLVTDLVTWAAARHVRVRSAVADETDRLRAWSTIEGLLGRFDRIAPQPFDRALRLIETDAGTGPVVIVVDDVQWADSDSLEFLRMLARRAEMLPVLLVTASRPDPVSHAGRRLQEAAVRYGCQLQLEPLGHVETAELVAMSVADGDDADVMGFVEGAGGNPFLITEVLRQWDVGSGRAAWPSPRRSPPGQLPIIEPAIVTRVMGRMLDDIDGDSELLIRSAAALPPGFGCDELAAVTGRPINEVMAWTLSLVRSGVLNEHGRGLCFRHSLLRDIVRQSTPTAVSEILRRSAVSFLGRSDGPIDRAVVCFLDGFEPELQDEVETAIGLAVRARSMNPTACADLLGAALPHLRSEDPRYLRSVVDLGWSLLAIGRADDVPSLISRHFGDSVARLPAELLSLEGSAMALSGRLDLALRRYEGYDIARIEAEFDTSDPAVVDAVAELAGGWVSTGDLPGGLALLAWVEQSATPSSPTRVASIEATRALSCGLTGRFAASIEHARASLRAIADGTGPIVTPASPIVSIALGLDLNGDSVGALTALRDRDLPGIVPAWTEPLFQFAASIVLFRRGDWDDALTEAEAGLAAADEVGLRLSVFWPYAVGALIHLARNRRDLATASLANCTDVAGSRSVGTEWLTFAEAMLQAGNGEIDTASATLRAVCGFLIDAELDALLLGFGPESARLAVRAGATESLPGLEAGLMRLVAKSSSPVARATANWVHGLARCDGAAMTAASEQFATVDRRPDAARAAADAAIAWQTSGDTLESRRLAQRAFEGFDRLGAESDHARLRADLRDIGLQLRPRRTPTRPAAGWQSLTPSEHSIVELVGEGLTNGEISDRLFVSRRTVESHLARVFTKVNVSSRTQLIAARHNDVAATTSRHGRRR